jgi:hypothetical protein
MQKSVYENPTRHKITFISKKVYQKDVRRGGK